jgi:hypothetical protein
MQGLTTGHYNVLSVWSYNQAFTSSGSTGRKKIQYGMDSKWRQRAAEMNACICAIINLARPAVTLSGGYLFYGC